MTPLVQLAGVADAGDLAEVFQECFNDEYFQSLFPPTQQGREYVKEAYDRFIRSQEIGLQEAKVWVIRDDDGRVVSGAVFWIIKQGEGGISSWRQRWPVPTDGLNDELLNEFFTGMEGQHHHIMGSEEHIYLEVVVTKPSFQRRGYCTALLRQGLDVADEVDYASYLDAEKDAVSIYERVGYKRKPELQVSEVLMPMMKPKKSVLG